MTHFTFIATAYGVSLLGLAVLALWLVLDYRGQKHLLDEMEARRKRRRREAAERQLEARRAEAEKPRTA
ncbi:heme exporter protein CcmD [Xanthobacter sp. TB0139]|uniref:heme exporter protein CcmD n=1 Tax=Xanthobacter sp. TB0139 TaxID=3459178 RepID=UPI00403A4004